ncbi:MAG TPA: VOC family protein [Dehalococcoidia bacterium]|jgi:catechol 2,3-dioxygenase-like lactoylglutathione lyase family enzyme|nr:VOC family protein [Dehalococcoidia bacterium]
MGKIRHIAYRCSDIPTYEKFFVEGLGMEVVQRRPGGAVDLTDGTLNITLLASTLTPLEGEASLGVAHIGFEVEDEAATMEKLKALGATEANAIRMSDAHYELKFQGPDGIVVDLGHWAGTAPINEAERVAT